MTCWNSERFTVPSLSMSDSSRIWKTYKGNNCYTDTSSVYQPASLHLQRGEASVNSRCWWAVSFLPWLVSSHLSRRSGSLPASPDRHNQESHHRQSLKISICLSHLIHSLTCILNNLLLFFVNLFTKYTECIVGFDFQSSRVAEGTQEIQKVLKCEASVFVFRCGEHVADSFPERVGLWREQQVQGSVHFISTWSTSEQTKHIF